MPSDHDDLRDLALQLALHEAGHAVAAVARGFRLIRIKFSEGWVGETETTACDVRPDCGSVERQRNAAIAALAGREARRRRYPQSDLDWAEFENSDLRMARLHLGLPLQVSADTEPALNGVTEGARLLLAEPANRRAVETLANWLLQLGTREAGQIGFPSEVSGDDALAVIMSAGVRPDGRGEAP